MSSNAMVRATAAQYLKAFAWATGSDQAGLLHPTGNPDLELDGFAVRTLRTSPRGRNIHFEVLGRNRRDWMCAREFLSRARVLGYFRRHPETGVLRWIQPMGAPDGTGPVAFVVEEPRA